MSLKTLSRSNQAVVDAEGADTTEPKDEKFILLEQRARAVLEELAANGEQDEVSTVEFANTLREYRQACQDRARYVEADLVQQVLRHLRYDEETRHVRGLTEQQRQERQAVEDAHREEFMEFHRVWNARIDEFEEHQMELETTLLERQNMELQAFYKEMNNLTPNMPRCSRGLLDTRAVEHILATQRQYARAHRTKLKADRLEARDVERFMQAKIELFERREELLRQKHHQEHMVLKNKMELRRAEFERLRKRELDVLCQRYVNIRRELELQQNIVLNKTGTILLKHANNTKSDVSGSAALVESAGYGVFGSTVKRRHFDDAMQRCSSFAPHQNKE
ncbi:putative immunodominant antigen, putative,tc40 antigen-like [Trypanosoma rangeli]|uniref:Putative immunodominant antigen, putative,tc40 antigen-like n=1 Tax=Trypanosoma rangeli TaxID=5698 RepID=A0A422P583_TRYRA|nr:putative immunodominant antigen, putative,tc40 antigen-like [Trypanosoma rangeli]RNF12845.1 putative immunodominant antigen, putative,tc40 antigen-like [Trypanosoma rangeli]|eukprot:RNF12845.1 putative immunodominant antigen, putative,tc40 antigen-like [Trypanosoma rangeli]